MVEIRTARLLLRAVRPSDLDDLHAVLSDRTAMRYWSSLPHASIDDTRAWLDDMIAIPPAEGEDFVIEHAGRVIGKAGFYRFPEIGFILRPDHWGLGLAAEALTPLIGRAFDVHGLERIVADVDPRNVGSLNLLRRLNFAENGFAERTWLIGEEWCDSIYLSLERPSPI
jgi:RimJ/RimL family protein N-acetyltransferase